METRCAGLDAVHSIMFWAAWPPQACLLELLWCSSSSVDRKIDRHRAVHGPWQVLRAAGRILERQELSTASAAACVACVLCLGANGTRAVQQALGLLHQALR